MAYFSPGEILSGLVAERGPKVARGISYGSHARHKLDLYQPQPPNASAPIVLFLYGGAWIHGDRATYGFVGSALAARGITTVIADYRLYPEVKFPDFVDDAARAYAWVTKHLHAPDNHTAQKLRPVFLMGHSAGAHTSALLAYNQSYIARAGSNVQMPAGLIGLAGPYAFDPTTWPSTKAIFATATSADNARPVSFVRPGAPPTLLLHGADDTTVKLFNTRELATALKVVGTAVEKAEYAGVGHVGLVLTLAAPLRWRAPTLETIVSFVGRVAGLDATRGTTPR